MANQPLKTSLNQLADQEGPETKGFYELSSDEAEELAGGLRDDFPQQAAQSGCPASNSGCNIP